MKIKETYLRHIITLATPVILTGVAEPLINTTDLVLVGQKINGGISAVGLGSSATLAIVWIFSALLHPISARVGFYFGKKELDKIKALTQYTLLRLIIFFALFSSVLYYFSAEIIQLYTPKEARLATMATHFLEIRLLGLPFLLGSVLLFQVFKEMQNTKTAFYITLVAGLVNLFGDYLLIDHFGVRGAAFASSLSHLLMFVISLAIAFRMKLLVKSSTKLNDLSSLFKNSLNLMIRTILLNITLFVGNKITAQQGDLQLELHTILGNLFLIAAFFLDGTASAATAICSKLNGENNQHAILSVGLKSVAINIFTATCFACLGYLTYPYIFRIYTENISITPLFENMMIFYFSTILLGGVAFTMDGLLIGLERVSFLRNVLIGSTLFYVLILLLTQNYTLEGVWFALLCWMFIRAVFPLAGFVRKQRTLLSHNT